MNELEGPLMPSSLVTGKQIPSMREYNSEEEDFLNETPNDAHIHELAKSTGALLVQTEKRISYGLTRVSKMQRRQRNKPEINKVDVVRINSKNNWNRLLWKLCKVEELIKGRDNVI